MADKKRSNEARNLVITMIEDHPKAIIQLRMASKRAQEMGGTWRAVFIASPVSYRPGQQERILRLLTIAQQMGGETEVIEAADLLSGIKLLFKRDEPRLGLVIIGRAEPSASQKILGHLPWMKAVNLAGKHALVEIIPLSGLQYQYSWSHWLKNYVRGIKPLYMLYALIAVAFTWLLLTMVDWWIPQAMFSADELRLGALFMITCAFVAGRFGIIPGLIAAIGSFLIDSYMYVQPKYSLQVQAVHDGLNLGVFMLVAISVSLITSKARYYAEKISRNELGTQLLFNLYRVTSECSSVSQALEVLHERLGRMLDMEVVFLMPSALESEKLDVVFPKDVSFDDKDRFALQECWHSMKTTGFAAPYNPGTRWRFEPMISSGGEVGVLAVRSRQEGYLDISMGRLLSAIADQTANVLEHIELERSMEASRITEEREKLRAMLLSSVSHDLKTPLAGIIGALSVYKSLGERISLEKRKELIESSLEEAQRLDSFITNILEMTRLEAGSVKFRMGWYPVSAMIEQASRRLQGRLQKRQLIVHPMPKDVEVYMDLSLMGQALQNILDNACKYTQPETRIEVGCVLNEEQGMLCEVRDHGEGIPVEKLESIFDKYARLHKKDAQVAGTGLGLSIAKAILEGQGGWIVANNHPEGGAVFSFCLPKWRQIAVIQSYEEPAPVTPEYKELVCS